MPSLLPVAARCDQPTCGLRICKTIFIVYNCTSNFSYLTLDTTCCFQKPGAVLSRAAGPRRARVFNDDVNRIAFNQNRDAVADGHEREGIGQGARTQHILYLARIFRARGPQNRRCGTRAPRWRDAVRSCGYKAATFVRRGTSLRKGTAGAATPTTCSGHGVVACSRTQPCIHCKFTAHPPGRGRACG